MRHALLALPFALALTTAHAQDAQAGGAAFLQCSECHATSDSNGAGPGLKGVVGRRAGTKAGFVFSPAMAKSALTWDAATLDAYLANPRAKVPGTTMDFPGVDDPTERANLVAYLTTLK